MANCVTAMKRDKPYIIISSEHINNKDFCCFQIASKLDRSRSLSMYQHAIASPLRTALEPVKHAT